MNDRTCPRTSAVAVCVILAAAPAAAGEPSPPDAGERIIYGSDDRLEAYQISGSTFDPVLDSTAALLWEPAGLLTWTGDGWDIDTSLTFQDWLSPLCPSEPYGSQPVPGFCSGFLVSPDHIVTAGHCITSQSDCDSTSFVFGFHMEDPVTPVAHVPADDVYECAGIVDRIYTATDDWALVTTDRPVTGHMALPLRLTGSVEADPAVEGLIAIGHPVGLPTKISGGAEIKEASHADYFQANLDVYVGSSGSVVLSVDGAGRPLLAEGIVVRGNDDFTWTGTCYQSNVCPDDTGCAGTWEEASRATRFSALVPPLAAPGRIPDGAGLPGAPLEAGLGPGGEVILSWSPSCAPGDLDYAVYQGLLGEYTSHLPVTCTTSGSTSAVLPPGPGSSYYLVVPRNALNEGSYGLRGDGSERLPSAAACLVQIPSSCG